MCKSRKFDSYIDNMHGKILQYERLMNQNRGKKQRQHYADYKKQLKTTLRCIALNLYVTGKISDEHRLILPSGASYYLTNFKLRSIGLLDYRYVKSALALGGLTNAMRTRGFKPKEEEIKNEDGTITIKKKKGKATSYKPMLQYIREIEQCINLQNIKQTPIKKQDLVILRKRKKHLKDGETETAVTSGDADAFLDICEAVAAEATAKKKRGKRKADPKKLKIRATKEVQAARDLLLRYNKLLGVSKIEFKPSPQEYAKIPKYLLPNTLQIQTYQLYTPKDGSNKDLDHHGRMYGGFWIPLKSNLRKHITINNEPVVELDFRTMHPMLLYIQQGVDFRNPNYAPATRKAPYDLYGNFKFAGFKANTDKHRNLAKKLFNAAINAKDYDAAIGSVMRDYNREKKKPACKYPALMAEAKQKRSLETALNALLKRHEPIAKFLNKDAGMRLMRYDSMIAEKVMRHFTDKGEVVLTVHDSFLVRASLEKELKEVMFNALQEVATTTIRGGYLLPYKADEVIKKQ